MLNLPLAKGRIGPLDRPDWIWYGVDGSVDTVVIETRLKRD